MISGIVPGRSLGLAAASGRLVSCRGIFRRDASAARRKTPICSIPCLASVGMQFDKDQDAIDYRRAGADRRSASQRICRRRKRRSAIRPGPRIPMSSPHAARRWISRRPAPQINAQYARRNVPDGAAARQWPAASEGPPDECQAGAGHADLPLRRLEGSVKSMVAGASTGKRPAGTGAAAQISDRAAAGLQKGDGGRQGNHRSAEGST